MPFPLHGVVEVKAELEKLVPNLHAKAQRKAARRILLTFKENVAFIRDSAFFPVRMMATPV
jgi:hypothetical protein